MAIVIKPGSSQTLWNLWGLRVLAAAVDGTQTDPTLAYASMTLEDDAGPAHLFTSLETLLFPSVVLKANISVPASANGPLVIEIASTKEASARLGVASGATVINIAGATVVNQNVSLATVAQLSNPTINLPTSFGGIPTTPAPTYPRVIAQARNTATQAVPGSTQFWLPFNTSGISETLATSPRWVDIRGYREIVLALEGQGIWNGATVQVQLAERLTANGGQGVNDWQLAASASWTFGKSATADSDGWTGISELTLRRAEWGANPANFLITGGRGGGDQPIGLLSIMQLMRVSLVTIGSPGPVPIYRCNVWGMY